MNLNGQKVIHKSFGEGIVTEHNESYITISFSGETFNFVFPDAFEIYLKASDEAINMQIAAMLDKISKEKEADKLAKEIQQKRVLEKKKLIYSNKAKTPTRLNIAFKCNYCDGGKSNTQIGFNGVCSDATIYNNIEIERKTWCTSSDCACMEYHHGYISRKELENIFTYEGSLCYESAMLRDWIAAAGVVQTGSKKGTPMKLTQVQNNSLCVLTTRDPKSRESMRYIFGVFLVDENYDGDSREAGYVSTSSKYKIKLSQSEAHKMLFWNYHKNENDPATPKWSSGLHRYFEDEQAVQILKDIVKIKSKTKDEKLAVEFLKHFCQINGINIDIVGEPNGALRLK